jgi:hypothetical protein
VKAATAVDLLPQYAAAALVGTQQSQPTFCLLSPCLLPSRLRLVLQDRQPGGGWYCFDDTSVEAWDPAKLDRDCFGGRFVPEGFTQVPRGGTGKPGRGACQADAICHPFELGVLWLSRGSKAGPGALHGAVITSRSFHATLRHLNLRLWVRALWV